MNRSTAITATDAISTYILAKDSNRPQLMKRAFAGDCELEMVVNTDAISFPSSARGLEQITQVLVTDFGDQYENIRTFCLSRPTSDYLPHFRCDWLVGMSAKRGGAIRVGCGHYSWQFGPDDDGRVKKLVIDIEVMSVLPVERSGPCVFGTPVARVLAQPKPDAVFAAFTTSGYHPRSGRENGSGSKLMP